ncbi:DUF3231 family protein [Bacillus suaedaesalsae]|uniref:DUF3231 family protein n=1 Tax=Bacillus suaedaesalsae TaxID=2810349 RepID=A0ABS2DL48_9BACI|nr:DUF3231 family protein [Bacillus suaedaesalsae]MBM6619208.1 DUF3231 family protein [Bacillus suaedaesalsae]
MKIIKPTENDDSNNFDPAKEKITSAEMGKLWAVFMGNSMSICVLSYFLQHVDDTDTKAILEDSLELAKGFTKGVAAIFEKEQIPIPIGFTEKDVNLGAPRLVADEFYLHYLKYAAKAGLSLYSTAIPLMIRKDVRDFILKCNKYTTDLLNTLNELMSKKGILNKPPLIPIPDKVDFIKKQNYLNGFFRNVRSLHALEVSHLHDNLENNATSKGLLIAFSQVAKKESVREIMLRGKEIARNHFESCAEKLHNEDLPSPPLLDDLIEATTVSPFSDKLILFHKVDMFNMKIRTYASALSLNGRRDIGMMYGRFITDVGRFVEDAANLMISEGWFEQPPKAADRKDLAKH